MRTSTALLVLWLVPASAAAELPAFYRSVDRVIWIVEDMDQTLVELHRLGFTN